MEVLVKHDLLPSYDTAELAVDVPVEAILNMSTKDGKIDDLEMYGTIPEETSLPAGTSVKIIMYEHIAATGAKSQVFVAPDKWQTNNSADHMLVIKIDLDKLQNTKFTDSQAE